LFDVLVQGLWKNYPPAQKELYHHPFLLELKRLIIVIYYIFNRYGENKFPEPVVKSFIRIFFESFLDTTLIILMVMAVVSIILGSIFDEEHDSGDGVSLPGYVDGIAILGTVVIVARLFVLNVHIFV
jgi:magnesium-transporting ATPase (P-type)